MLKNDSTSVLAHAFAPFVHLLPVLALLFMAVFAEPSQAAFSKTDAPELQDCVILERKAATSSGGVRPGETMDLVLRQSLPSAEKIQVMVGDVPAVVTQISPCKVSFKVPETLKKGEYPVALSLDKKPFATAAITVYSSVIPTVLKIYPVDVRPGKMITVTGTGLAGPNERVLLQVGKAVAKTVQVDPGGMWFAAVFGKDLSPQWDKTVQVKVMGVAATPPTDTPLALNLPFCWVEMFSIAGMALVPVVIVFWFVYRLFRKKQELRSQVVAAGGPLCHPRGFLQSLVYEPENNTLSLSRAQLVWWLVLISYGYVFFFFAQHQVHEKWEMLPLGNFPYTFLISLLTLVGSQATTRVRGAKGAGVCTPGWSDLVTNGGVLALDRVQQLFWTGVIGIAFIIIVLGSYNIAGTMPSIPTELLVLMGLSSTAYIAGKAIGKPGPIISQVLGEIGSLKVKIYGINLSMGPMVTDGKTTMPQDAGVRILIDDKVQPVDKIRTVETDPNDPTHFAKVLEVEILDVADPTKWLMDTHKLRVINADGQSADWLGKMERREGAAQPQESKQQDGQGPQAGQAPPQPDQPPQQPDQAPPRPQPSQAAEGAASQKREPTEDTESRIPAAPGDPAGGKEPPVAGDDEGPDEGADK